MYEIQISDETINRRLTLFFHIRTTYVETFVLPLYKFRKALLEKIHCTACKIIFGRFMGLLHYFKCIFRRVISSNFETDRSYWVQNQLCTVEKPRVLNQVLQDGYVFPS